MNCYFSYAANISDNIYLHKMAAIFQIIFFLEMAAIFSDNIFLSKMAANFLDNVKQPKAARRA